MDTSGDTWPSKMNLCSRGAVNIELNVRLATSGSIYDSIHHGRKLGISTDGSGRRQGVASTGEVLQESQFGNNADDGHGRLLPRKDGEHVSE